MYDKRYIDLNLLGWIVKTIGYIPDIPYDLTKVKHLNVRDFGICIIDPYYEIVPSWIIPSEGDYSIIGEMQNLKSLLFSEVIIKDFSFLTKCRNLQKLDLSKTNFSDCTLLTHIPKLTNIRLGFPDDLIHKQDLEKLTAKIEIGDSAYGINGVSDHFAINERGLKESQKIYRIDFSKLSNQEKRLVVLNFSSLLENSFSNSSFAAKMQAQLLVFTRWWNSYRLMEPDKPTPRILKVVIDILWDYHEGNLRSRELTHFQKYLSSIVSDIMTGDDNEMKKDPACKQFSRIYFSDWSLFYNVFLTDLSVLLEELVSRKVTWEPIGDMLIRDIADTKIDFFEEFDSVNSVGNKSAQLDQRVENIYQSKTFCHVIELIQQDISTSLEEIPIRELRSLYQKEYLFSPENSLKITFN